MRTKRRQYEPKECTWKVEPLTESFRRGFKTIVVETEQDGLASLTLKAVTDIERILVVLRKPLPTIH